MNHLPSEYQADARKDLPLRSRLVDKKRLVIDVGIRTVAFCGEAVGDVKVNAPMRFTQHVLDELNREGETGETLLTKALDAAIHAAIENGSDAVTAEGD